MRHSLTNLKQLRASGFTIPELMIVIVVSGILIGVLFGPLDDLYTSNSRGLKSVLKIADTRGALRSIENKISLSDSFYNTNSVADPAGTTWSWTGSGTTSRVLITGNYATTIDEAADTSNTRAMVYATNCYDPIINNYVYFVSGGTLYRRTLKNTSATCSGLSVGQKQSCAAGFVNSACEGVDAKILTGVTNFTVDYYANADDTTPIANEYVTTTVPSTAKAVSITLTAKSGDGTTDTTTTSKLRITRINGTGS